MFFILASRWLKYESKILQRCTLSSLHPTFLLPPIRSDPGGHVGVYDEAGPCDLTVSRVVFKPHLGKRVFKIMFETRAQLLEVQRINVFVFFFKFRKTRTNNEKQVTMTTVRGWRGAIVIGYRDWFLTYYDSYQPTETSNATKHGFETIRSWEKKLNKTKTTTVSWISSLIDHSLVAFFSFFFFFNMNLSNAVINIRSWINIIAWAGEERKTFHMDVNHPTFSIW